MDVSEVKKLKAEVEDVILEVITDFERRTGTSVVYINYDKEDLEDPDGSPSETLVECQLVVQIL